MAVDQKKLKADLQLNQYLNQVLLEVSPEKRDEMILLAKVTLLNILKESPNEQNVQRLMDLELELSKILVGRQIDMEELMRFHQLVSKAMRNNFKRETVILVNMEISQAMVDGSQEVIRDKSVSALRLLSQGTIDCTGNEDVEALFKLNEALTLAIAEKSEDKKRELLASSNLLLAKFMAAGYPDTSIEWLMELNRLAASALVERSFIYLWKAMKLFSQEMRKMVDEVFLKDLLELSSSLSCLLPEARVGFTIATFCDQLIAWKMQLSIVVQEVAEESSKTKKTTTEETMSRQLAAALAENEKLKNEIPKLIQATDAKKEEARKVNVAAAELAREVMEGKEKIDELVKRIGEMEEKLRGGEEGKETTVGAGRATTVVAEEVAGKPNVGDEKKAGAEEVAGKPNVGDEKKAGAEEVAGKPNVGDEKKAGAEEVAGKPNVGDEKKAGAEEVAGKPNVGDEKKAGAEEVAGKPNVGDEKKAGAEEVAGKPNVGDEKKAGAEEVAGKPNVGDEKKAGAEEVAVKPNVRDEKKAGAEEVAGKPNVGDEKKAGAEEVAGKPNVGDEKEAGAEEVAGKPNVGDEKKVGAEEAASSKKEDEAFQNLLKKPGGTVGIGKGVVGPPPRRQMIPDANKVEDEEKLNEFEGWRKRKEVKKTETVIKCPETEKPEAVIKSAEAEKPETVIKYPIFYCGGVRSDF